MIVLVLIFGIIIMGVVADIDNKSQELQSEFRKKQNFETYNDWINKREHKPSKKADPFSVIFSILIIVSIMGVLVSIFQSNKNSDNYSKAKNQYLAKRNKLLEELDN